MFTLPDLMPERIRIKKEWIERLQDISDEDCIKEGIISWSCRGNVYYGFFDYSKNKFVRHKTLREAYATLINLISGKDTWESNPYVFAYEFELIK